MTHYLSWPISELPSTIGVQDEDGLRVVQDSAGFASYGPHCRLGKGKYFAGFYIRALERSEEPGILHVDVCRNGAVDIIAARSVSGAELLQNVAGLIGTDFSLDEEVADIEVRLQVTNRAAIAVRSLVIFKNEAL